MAAPPKITLADLLANPEHARTLDDAQVRDTLKQIGDQTSALKTLETQILSRLVLERTSSSHYNPFPKLLNAKELAEHLGVPETWVREQARLGHLPSIKLGHYVRFRLDDVQHYLHPAMVSHIVRATSDREELDIIHRMHDKEEIWPPLNDFTNRSVPAELADVLTAWTTVLWAHMVHESGFFSRLRKRLKSTSPKQS